MARRICVVTGSRADYGLLYWLIKELHDDADVTLQLAVTGMHLSTEFDLTYRRIEADGFTIDARIEMLLASDAPSAIAKSTAVGLMGFADAFERLAPDIVVVLGDRFEILAAAQAAMFLRIPIAHIPGGEASEGAIDEAIRHALTKMAHLHFTTAEPYRRRVIQMGENPARVFNVGAPGLDNLRKLRLLDRAAMERELQFALEPGPVLLCTYHPATLAGTDAGATLPELFRALDQIPEARVVFTRSNADAGGRRINELVDAYVARNSERMAVFTSLGQLRYLSLLTLASAVIGNSSSAILEAPTARTPAVNIGSRQRGRLRAPSVIDCEETASDIATAIRRALSPEFRAIADAGETPFGTDDVSAAIARVLKSVSLDGIILKSFHDLPVS